MTSFQAGDNDLEHAGVAGHRRSLHVLDPPGCERGADDRLAHVIAHAGRPQADPQQQLAAWLQDSPELIGVRRPAGRWQVVKAAPVEGGVKAVPAERELARVRAQEGRVAVAVRCPGDGRF
jgi:hypothetical protein